MHTYPALKKSRILVEGYLVIALNNSVDDCVTPGVRLNYDALLVSVAGLAKESILF